jgi:hypothetical protein
LWASFAEGSRRVHGLFHHSIANLLEGSTMPTTLTIRDETTAGQTLQEWSLEFLTERITVREKIRSRVYQEVQDYNLQQPAVFRGLVEPTDAERTLNGFKLRKGRHIDWKQQFEKALEGFRLNRILILVGDRQAESLDEEIVIAPGTEVVFLRLVPLAGG